MKHIPTIIISLVFIALMPAAWTQSDGLAKSGYWERTSTLTNTGASNMETTKTWWELDRKRTEIYTVSGLIVEIRDGSTLYRYVPEVNKALKIVIPEGKAPTVQQELEALKQIAKVNMEKGTKIGSGKDICGLICDAYKVKNENESARIYVSTDSRFPVILQADISSGKRTESSKTKQIKLNYNVPDTMFTLPKGVKIEVQKLENKPSSEVPNDEGG